MSKLANILRINLRIRPYLSISKCALGAQNLRLTETVLLSTYKIICCVLVMKINFDKLFSNIFLSIIRFPKEPLHVLRSMVVSWHFVLGVL